MSEKSQYIYGRHPVSEALRARPRDVIRLYLNDGGQAARMGDIVRAAQHHKIHIVRASNAQLQDMVGDAPHQGIVAAVQPFAYATLRDILDHANRKGEAPLVVALDQIQDPHNLGAIVRSALALGAHGVVIPKDRAAEVTPTVVKSAAGATAHLPIAKITNMRSCLEELKTAGLWVYGAAAGEGKPLRDLDMRNATVIVIGSEGKGMRRLVAETCDDFVHIPMAGDLGSLNASVATAVVLYEAARQRATAPDKR